MSSVFADGALHPGRDAADSWWIPIHRPENWAGAELTGVTVDPDTGTVELAPAPLAAGDPDPSITGADGTEYRADPITDQVLWRRRCDAGWMPIAGLGGPGWSTGRFRDPAGLAVDDRGLLYVADRGNHRVQVIAPEQGRVVIVLGAVDAWGRPAPGAGRGQLTAPIAVAVGRSRIFVAEASARISVWDREFRFDRSFVAARPGATTAPALVGIGIDGDDLLVVADASWSRLLRFGCDGRWRGELGYADAPLGLSWLGDRARFAATGTLVLGPIDGGVDRLAWHEIAVDAMVPAGTAIEVQTFAVDPLPSPPPGPPPSPPLLTAATRWAPAAPVAIARSGVDPRDGEATRPVLSDTTLWEQWQAAPFRRGARVHAFTGDGPSVSATFAVPASAARLLRAGDGIELGRGSSAEAARISSVPDRTATVEAAGPGFVLYVAGATVTLVERDGQPTPAVLHVLAGVEAVSLTGFTMDGEVGDVALPHALAALLQPGDVLELAAPLPALDRARLSVDSIDASPVIITLTAPTVGDHRTAEVRVVESVGRLVVEQATGWGRGLPPGSTISVDWDDAGTLRQVELEVRWSDPAVATVWTTAAAPATWLALEPGARPAATDRGRYLWVKLRLRGARPRRTDALATATPSIRGLRLVAPRASSLAVLPAVYARRDDRDPSGALFTERYLAMFEHRLADIEARYERVARQLNPMAADAGWLQFIAGWFDLALDPSWLPARRAQLVAEIFTLYQIRGTGEGIRRAVELYTGRRPALIEGFQLRPRAGLVLGCEGSVGCAPLGGLDTGAAASEQVLGDHAHRFTLVAYAEDDCDLGVAERVIRSIVDATKPAHTIVDLRVIVPDSRIGLSTSVGLDFLLGDGRATVAPLGAASGAARPAPVLGVDARLRALPGAPPMLDDVAPTASVGELTLR